MFHNIILVVETAFGEFILRSNLCVCVLMYIYVCVSTQQTRKIIFLLFTLALTLSNSSFLLLFIQIITLICCRGRNFHPSKQLWLNLCWVARWYEVVGFCWNDMLCVFLMYHHRIYFNYVTFISLNVS